MFFHKKIITKITVTTFCLIISCSSNQPETKQNTTQPKTNTPPRGGMMQFSADPRVQKKTYHFRDTNEDLYYDIYVSTKVSKDKKSPLIVTLHGLGAGPEIMMSKQAVDLAEAGGYILVGPMGYNVSGWYGITSMKGFGNFGGSGKKAPDNVNELSEKDVMNVLNIVCKEYNVDEKRIYLMGHSMGGAGTIYLGTKYPEKWAALAPVAPAAFTLNPGILESAKAVPFLFVHGDKDNIVPIKTTSKRFVDKMKELKMTYEYNEMKGADHGSIIFQCLPGIYEFFDKHSKK